MSSKPSHTQHSGTGLQLNQSATSQILRREYKKKEKRFIKYYNIDEPRQFAADRAVGNMHEHMAPILALFFAAMFACMYNGTSSANVSYAMWLYTFGRIIYLPIFKANASPGGIRPGLLIATTPCYLAQGYLIYVVLTAFA
eukprot:m.245405 g.245405  ORF g.245405 m.245405 type:complete len:141 (-) comp17468_c0_seq29:342-764(-)